jgi:hypothetical protein
VQLPRGGELPLKTRAVEGVIDVGCTELAHHRDDPRAAEVGRVRHRRSPVVGCCSARRFTDQLRMSLEQHAKFLDAIVADGVGDFARENESRPTRETVAARQRELGVDECRRIGIGMRGMVGGEILERVGITAANRAEQILGLSSELTQVGMHGEMTVGHGQPPLRMPDVR